MEVKDILDVKDLLKRFPGGFAITPSGKVMEVVGQFQDPNKASLIPPPRDDSRAWGFLVVAMPLIKLGDSERFEKKRISVDDFYKVYRSQIFFNEEEVDRTIQNLNTIGVGIDHEYTVNKEKEGDAYKLVLT